MALFDALVQHVAERARERANAALKRAEDALAQYPDVRIRRVGDYSTGSGELLVIDGIGLMRRWMSDVRLRLALWRSQ